MALLISGLDAPPTVLSPPPIFMLNLTSMTDRAGWSGSMRRPEVSARRADAYLALLIITSHTRASVSGPQIVSFSTLKGAISAHHSPHSPKKFFNKIFSPKGSESFNSSVMFSLPFHFASSACAFSFSSKAFISFSFLFLILTFSFFLSAAERCPNPSRSSG